ncbi:hypothetical protein [Priestia flexa]|uniref:hypothetical protein n=2 Tax=Priestia flexa TaxID=86664 RepID=UPI0012E856E4|nr:hypothetical protein [Priestia flexa]MED4588545.1 hypothetical protein [Priestia flexa]
MLVLGTCIKLWKVIRKKKPPTKFEHFHSKAYDLEEKGKLEEAISMRSEGIKNSALSPLERGDLHFGNAYTYVQMKRYKKATLCFDNAFEEARHEEFPYDKQYEQILEIYLKAGREQDALRIVEELIERSYYDKEFLSLETAKQWVQTEMQKRALS